MTDPLFESLIDEFLLEARERIERVEALLLDLETAAVDARAQMRDDARRELHTLKGNAAMMGLGEMQALAHRLEDNVEQLDLGAIEVTDTLQGVDRLRVLLDGVAHRDADGEAQTSRDAPPPVAGAGLELREPLAESVRVPFSALDSLVEQLQEMVIFRNRLADVIERGRSQAAAEDHDAWDAVREAEAALHRVFEGLQSDVMTLRLVPLRSLFRNLRRIVHDESAALGKSVVLETFGGDTPMDKALLEVASDALGHLVRNAVIHGLETPEARAAAGKQREGVVRLSARVVGEEVHIEVADDGGGIDLERLRRAARAKGIEVADDLLERLVFAAGVSTKQEADLSAGRGIGLSAVLESVERQAGRVEVRTERGRGSEFLLRLPLTVSVTQALLVRADGEHYALPFSTVVESRSLQDGEVQEIGDSQLLRWREQLIPLTDLGSFFGTTTGLRQHGEVVIVDAEGQGRALLVDAIVGSRDIVVKGLDEICSNPPGISGSTILGDGTVVLILDPARIGRRSRELELRGEGA
jgi:two-component system chemotaxis sensor kinase CheA